MTSKQKEQEKNVLLALKRLYPATTQSVLYTLKAVEPVLQATQTRDKVWQNS